MKVFYIILLLLPKFILAAPADDFVITVKTDNPGGLPTEFEIIAAIVPGFAYNFNVDCNNDGTDEATGLTASYTCDYSALGLGAGTYTIRIKDNTGVGNGFPRASFFSIAVNKKIIAVEQWGTGLWRSMASAFSDTENMVINATDVPNFSNVTTMKGMFRNAILANPNTTNWDTSAVTDMSSMFSDATLANPDTSNWDTSLVTDMSAMFRRSASATPDTSGWNTSAVTNMNSMFREATSANPNTSNWDTSSVTDMSSMFVSATSANPNTSGWITSSVINMNAIFKEATSANPNTSSWDTSAVTDMSNMFSDATSANPDTSGWNTSSVTNMSSMFLGATSANPNTSSWNTSSVTNMFGMFKGATLANPDTSAWDTSSATNMSGMFSGASSANPDTSNWNTSLVTFMSTMFKNAISANPDTSSWNTSSVTNMGGMFNGATLANPDTSSWNTSSVTNMVGMFNGATLANPDTSGWNTSMVTVMTDMFRDAISANPNTSGWDTFLVTNMSNMFDGAILANPDTSNWDISNVTNMNGIFNGVTLPTSDYENMLIGFAAQNPSNSLAFSGGNSRYCSSAAQLARASLIGNSGWFIVDGGVCDPTDDFVITIRSDVPGFLTTDFRIETVGVGYNYNVDCNDDGTLEAIAQTDDYICDYSSSGIGVYTIRIVDNTGQGTGYARPMFNTADVRSKILFIEQWGSAQWNNMNKAFNDCDALRINATDTPDLSNVSNFRLMFSGATRANPNTTNWNMSSAVDVAGMFRNTDMAIPDTSNWDTSAVTDMSFMFNGATAADPDVANWDTSSVTNMSNMFAGAIAASPVINRWDVTSVTDMSAMLNGLTLPTSEYDATLFNYSVQNLNSDVVFGAGNSVYCDTAAIAGRDTMVTTYRWTISDGGQCLPEIIFNNGFESTVVVFKTAESVFSYDFSEIDLDIQDETPRLIAVGLDFYNQENVKVYTRLWQGILQIQISYLIDNSVDEATWSEGLWQDVVELGLTEISL